MILHLDENSKVQLTEEAFLIMALRKLYETIGDHDLAISHFGVLFYMYHYDSTYVREIEDESKRLAEVKKFVHRGNEVKVTRTMRKAMDVYKEIYVDDAAGTYLIMRRNATKLREYADKMVLFTPPIFTDNVLEAEEGVPVVGQDFFLVDSKEFATVTNLLGKQQEEIDKFEVHLRESAKSKIAVYGGGSLGAYE